jgi:ABC-type multidrug transport system fused ATPase/permease subunit
MALARRFEDWDVQQWLWETWRFVKMIFPLLIVGVFLVGVIRNFIEPAWIQSIAGSNTLLANMAGVVFGVFMYFPTLVEVPIAKMFLSLGMHPGPLIAYLMADPELSLQSILITSAIIGKLKAWTYVGLVALFSTVAGLTYGAWVDGMSLLILALLIGGVSLLLLVSTLHFFDAGPNQCRPSRIKKEFTMLIKILGSGCAKCNRLEQLTREAVAELGWKPASSMSRKWTRSWPTRS